MVMTETKLAEVNAYLMSGMNDREAAEKAGINIGTIWYGRSKGRIVPSTTERNKKTNVKNIDLAHMKLPQLMDNQKLDGTPDISPAFDEEDTSMDLVEYKTEQPIEAEPKHEEQKIVRTMKKQTKLSGAYIILEYSDNHVSIKFAKPGANMDGLMMQTSKPEMVKTIGYIIDELREAQAELAANY